MIRAWLLIRTLFRLSRDPNAPRLNFRLVHQFWVLMRLYWVRRGAWLSWLAVVTMVVWTLGSTEVTAYFIKLGGDKLNALSNRHQTEYYELAVRAALGSAALYLTRIVMDIPEEILVIHWNRWLTRDFIAVYLRTGLYHRIVGAHDLDNPDERIAADIGQFISLPLSLFRGFVMAISRLVVFGPQLWKLGPWLVGACAAWTAVDTVLSFVFNRPYLDLGYQSRRLQGNFRFSLVRVRTHSEAIAFARGHEFEIGELYRRYDANVVNDLRQRAWSILIGVCNQLVGVVSTLLPIFLLAPLYFNSKIDLSGFTQAQGAWSYVGVALGYFASEANIFAYDGAATARLFQLHKAAEELVPPPIEVGPRLEARALDVGVPGGERILVRGLNLVVEPGERVLITGPNGAGKTSLLRVLAGLWIAAGGSFVVPESMEFAPNMPELLKGTLAEQVTYPSTDQILDESHFLELLSQVGLERLWERRSDLGVEWDQVLSPGERQRLGLTRLFLRRPQFAVLDEATSALDVEAEQQIYLRLRELGIGLISVGHRPELRAHHQRVLHLAGDGHWKMEDI